MKARNGQVALYLVMALLVIAVMMFANVNTFLAVRSKNRMMNAVDEAAITAARYQGYLLNRIGEMNVEHLRAAVLGEPWVGDGGESREAEMRMLSLIGPIRAIEKANDAANDWGYPEGEVPNALDGFRDHIAEILNDVDLYPRDDRNGLWPMYANALASALGGNPAVLPSYMEMANPGTSGLFASWGFYDVIRAKAWCWFSIGDRKKYLEMDPTQVEPSEVYPVEVPENSEVFSLHVTYMTWEESGWGGRFDAEWTNFVCQVTGLSREDFSPHATVTDPEQRWAFYDGNWGAWSPTFNPVNFPIAGSVKPEYDVAGCVASCMMLGGIEQLEDEYDDTVRSMLVTAEAKPIGTVEGLEGGREPVTAYNRFIAASRPGERIFTDAQLTLMGSVPRSPGVSMAPDWYEHVKEHSPDHLSGSCKYCDLWRQWIALRSEASRWLRQNQESCRAKGGPGGMTGGYEYAH